MGLFENFVDFEGSSGLEVTRAHFVLHFQVKSALVQSSSVSFVLCFRRACGSFKCTAFGFSTDISFYFFRASIIIFCGVLNQSCSQSNDFIFIATFQTHEKSNNKMSLKCCFFF